MKNYIGRIALSGMKGRKKDTVLTALVIILAFMFLTVSTILIASYTSTQEQQRYQLYGKWQALYAGTIQPHFDEILYEFTDTPSGSYPLIEELFNESGCVGENAVITIIGNSKGCGNIGTFSGDFENLASLNLSEGRMPENNSEIVIESSQLTYLGPDVGIGSEITLEFEWRVPVVFSPGGLSDFKDNETLMAAFEKSWNEAKDDPNSIYAWNDLDTDIPFDELDEETANFAWSLFFGSSGSFGYYQKTVTDSGQHEDVSWRLMTDKSISYPTGSMGLWGPSSGPPDSVGSVGKDALDALIESGKVDSQKLIISKNVTVSGIVETYSDRWDTDVALPNALVLPELTTQIDDIVASLSDTLASSDTSFAQGIRIYMMASNGLETAEFYDRLNEAYAKGGSPTEMITPYGGYRYELSPETGHSELVDPTKPGKIDVYDTESRTQMTLDYAYDEALESFVIETDREPIYVPYAEFFYFNLLGTTMMENGFLPPNSPLGDSDAAYKYNNSDICINRSAYPQETILGRSVNNLIIGVISVITICAVFQIFITQLHRRTGRLTTLKGIGATNEQVISLLVCEGLILLFSSLIIGDLLGFGIAYGVTKLTAGANDGSGITFLVDYSTLIPGQIGGILSVIIGMALPITRSFTMPLTGRRVTKRKPHKAYTFKPQTYAQICIRDAKSNSVRTVGIFLLCTLMAALQLVCLFIGNNSFADWRTTVIKNKRPDYIITVPYGMGKDVLETFSHKVAQMDNVSEVTAYKESNDVFLWFEGMNGSPILSATGSFSYPNEGTDANGEPIRSEKPYDDPGLATTLYAVDIGSEIYDKLIASLSEGSIDSDSYREGEQVIMVIPNYIEFSDKETGENTLILSLDPSDAEVFRTDTTLKCGDEIFFGGVSVSPTDQERLYLFRSQSPEVGGIINSLPEGGIWPFGSSDRGYTIIGSSKLMQKIFPLTSTYMTPKDTEFFLNYRKYSEFGTAYGESFINVYTDDNDNIGETLMQLNRFSKENVFTLENYRDSNTALYSKAVSSCMIILLLAIAVTLIAWLILYNTMTSTEEQGRKKTGILQAIGVDNRRFRNAHRLQAVIYATASLITANILLAAVVIISGAIARTGMAYGFFDMLRSISLQELASFPWMLYLIINASMLPILLIITRMAVKIPLSHSPIENIRS